MRRRTEHLVEKRDGRREFVRSTKLARSIHMALRGVGIDEDWRALELAAVTLEGLRQRHVGDRTGRGAKVVLTTAEIADAVQHLLVVTGQPGAAVSYGAVQAERARRRASVGALAPAGSPAGAAAGASGEAGGDPRRTRPGDLLGGRFAGEG